MFINACAVLPIRMREYRHEKGAVPQQRITVRGDGMGTAPVIPLAYLTVLSAKLVAMAFPNEQTAAELSDYDDERVMIVLGERLQTILEDLAGMPDGDDGASPVS